MCSSVPFLSVNELISGHFIADLIGSLFDCSRLDR